MRACGESRGDGIVIGELVPAKRNLVHNAPFLCLSKGLLYHLTFPFRVLRVAISTRRDETLLKAYIAHYKLRITLQ